MIISNSLSRITTLIIVSVFTALISVDAQENPKDDYVTPDDPLVQEKLEKWQNLKFGLFMHWGTYSQWGVLESWSICPEDWITRRGPYSDNYFEYKKAYENLQMTFNPVDFKPEKWVAAAKKAGMKYVVFTTKHHDGFCMFDTKQTDYKITSANTPFSKNPRSNITKEIFDAFRKKNFMIGAYFSKPDWHSEYYWWPYFPPKDRNVNYSIKKYPDRWQKFKDFTYNQIEELMTGYGPIDILWLDGGWVRPSTDPGDDHNQDIDMPRIATMARSHQPGLLVVDRTVGGKYENYTTPEQQVPEKPPDHPWETCLTIGRSWSWNPKDSYKSSMDLVHILIKIVSRGGNLLLNIAPGPNGDWMQQAYDRLNEIGAWININGEGIYDTKPVTPYSFENIYYTRSKNPNKIYAFWLSPQEDVAFPDKISIPLRDIQSVKNVSLSGSDQKLNWTYTDGKIHLNIPINLQKPHLKYAALFTIDY